MVTSGVNARLGKKRSFGSGGSDFSYKFTANRTFSREGGSRPETSPARILLDSRRRKREAGLLSPEDVIALAQSPSPEVISHSFGSSLLMLQSGQRRVRPDRFVDLARLSRKPVSPALSIRTDLPTPRMAKRMAQSLNRKQTPGTRQAGTQTSAGSSRSFSRRLSDAASLGAANDWVNPKDTSSQTAFVAPESVSDRCVRCSEFPDIQIEGRSLSRILTNPNTRMAREHCEILGAEACPDCIRIRSQRAHQRHCFDTSPAVPTEVYKLALIHEKAPHLTMRQVQRKVYDGEILDHISPVHRSISSAPAVGAMDQSEPPERQSEISVSFIRRKETRSRSLSKPPGTASTFETIHEAAELSSDDETDDELRAIQSSSENESDEELRRLEYRKVDAEKAQRVKVVRAKKHRTKERDVEGKTPKTEFDSKRIEITTSIVVANRQPVVEDVKQDIQPEESTSRPQFFTAGVVPSRDFFFDIGDLADRLRKSAVSKRAFRLEQKEEGGMLQHPIQDSLASKAEINLETGSVDSSESSWQATEFNMSFEPPVLFENKGRYLGVKAPQAGQRASTSR